eukprot:11174200-Lingulodinium_polyedra.AAC.1
MVVGEARWQNVVVECRIHTFKRTYDECYCPGAETTQLATGQSAFNQATRLVLEVCQVQNYVGKYGGASPHQWMIGREHPVFEGDDFPPIDGGDLG